MLGGSLLSLFVVCALIERAGNSDIPQPSFGNVT